jgi:hypothetical protein
MPPVGYMYVVDWVKAEVTDAKNRLFNFFLVKAMFLALSM